LFKHRGAVLLHRFVPAIRCAPPPTSFAPRWFAIGSIVAIFAWGLHVGAGTDAVH
jgi:hypothetical protein